MERKRYGVGRGDKGKQRDTHLLMLYARSGALRRNAVHCPETRKSVVRKACAMFSGSTNCGRGGHSGGGGARVRGRKRRSGYTAHLVELVAEVYRVDVVALEIGEHDNLGESGRGGGKKGEEHARRRPW